MVQNSKAEDVDLLEYQRRAWTRTLDSSANTVLCDHLHPFGGFPPGSGSRSMNGNSTRFSPDERIAQATSSNSHTLYLSSQDDGGTQGACRRREEHTTSSNDRGTPEVPTKMDHRRGFHAAREAEEGSRENGIFSNQTKPIPLQHWAYYPPPPPFVIAVPLTVIPPLPIFGAQTQCIIKNSGNVTNTYVVDSHNNNSTNLHIKKGT